MKVRPRTYKSGKTAWVMDARQDGKRFQFVLKGARNKGEAEAIAAALWAKAHRAKAGLERQRGEELTVGEWFKRDLSAGWRRARTVESYDCAFRQVTQEVGGQRLLSSLGTGDIEAAKAAWAARGAGNVTINGYLRIWRASMNRARAQGVEVGAAHFVFLPHVERVRRFLTAGEVKRMVNDPMHPRGDVAVMRNVRECIAFAAASGLRRSEQAGVTWDDVSDDRGKVLVFTAKGGAQGTRRHVWQPIGSAATRVLKDKWARGERFGSVFPCVPDGRTIKKVARRAGVKWWRHVRWHDLRHFYAMRLLEIGATVHEVAELMRHTTPTLVLMVYGGAREVRTQSLGALVDW